LWPDATRALWNRVDGSVAPFRWNTSLEKGWSMRQV
jgi:hypothetical protein